jgi:coenzyme F420-reducing hydrogenase alpha subunit
MKSKTIKVAYLARVEGEGGLHIKVRDNRVVEAKLNIFEAPRFFEALLRGRDFTEVPDIVARICGICPVAYQMSAVHAIEDAFGVIVGGELRSLRRLLYCGEWIASHALHVLMLHAPDFLGYEDAIAMAREHPDIVRRALKLKKTGNSLISLLGGREIHPINVRVGGFYKVPSKRDLATLGEQLKQARDEAVDIVRWAGTLPMPDFDQDYDFVALRHADEYPFNEGRLASTGGLDISIREYEDHFVEEQVNHSTALHSTTVTGGRYLVGPLARYNLNFENLSEIARHTAQATGLGPLCLNPFKSIIVRSVEILWALDEAVRIIDQYHMPGSPAIEVRPRAGVGYGCTEAPRGALYHRYRLTEDGKVAEAKIVPPTSQNQKTIESDLRNFVEAHLDEPWERLTWQCEQVIRNFDPCISCATHFLRIDRE